MNIKNTILVTLAVIMTIPGGKLAAGTNNLIELTDEVGTVGGQVMIDIIWTNSGTPSQTLQFDMLYDDTAFTFDSCPLNDPGNWVLPTCQVIGPGEIRLGLLDPDGLQDLTVGTLVLDVNGPAGMYQVTIEPGSIVTSDGDVTDTNPANIDVQLVPMPNYASTPPPGGTLFGTVVENPGNVQEVLNIENDGLATGGAFDATCSITTNPGGVYSLVSPVDGMFTLDIGENADLTIACDTTVAGDYTGGVLSCDHTAPNSPDPATYTLDCLVVGEPQYGSSPAPGDPLPALNGTEGNADPTTTLTIDNTGGEAGSVLSGTCGLTGDAAIYIDGTAAYSLAQGESTGITVGCDATSQGAFSSTLSCTHNDGDGDPTSPAEYAVSCEIGPPDPAIYASTPAAGATIDLNGGNPPPPVGDPALTSVLTISNAAAAGDDFLDLQGCTYTGDAEITASPDPVNNDLDPGQSVDVTFTCATDTSGMFTGTYTCPFDDNPSIPPMLGPEGGVVSPATYPVECEVRDQFSEVEVSPPSGTPQTAELMPGDSHVFTFTFTELVGEGADGSLDSCTLASGTDFAITDPASFPQPIPSGGTETVDVTFTDPGVGDTFTDTLTCLYTSNVDGGEPEQTEVSWPLEINVTGRNVRFQVTKDFDDDNPAGVEVMLECNTGLPLQQQGTVHDPDAVGLGPGDFTELNFVMVDFEPGAMDCDINEVVPDGYEASYFADIGEDGVAADVFADEEGCHYEGLESADFICEISNELLPVEVVVNKEWVDDDPSFNLPTIVEVTLFCNAEIVNGLNQPNGLLFSQEQFIDPSNPGVFSVLPDWDGSTECFVTEEVDAGVLGDVSDCESILLAPGVDGECTIVNTRLYAGIPTLSQYGLLLMALLMMGMGAVAFRRYV